MSSTPPQEPSRAQAQRALRQLLDEAQEWTAPTAALDPARLQAWGRRAHGAAGALAASLDGASRSRALEALSATPAHLADSSAVAVLRFSEGLTTTALSDLAGISTRTVQRVERGERCLVTVGFALARAFGLRPTDLLCDIANERGRCRTVCELIATLDGDEQPPTFRTT
ncbi:hypothetical protein GKE82_24360 [Conexibacter sp. W3-3-2]|uniref:helix-turn-helix transcriptional regulator n=1 Tax=Conexibacter sp. W3-3-2 TaxID=2675227 RepID=UPI0012B77C66|nr:helix-turn-helix transcriptional regulator [Conexibacter sp. W3-3-2]MTD47343.1 hypothetical protein [Conexibacter sp. W3-3-2]